ncbi:MAG: TetR/AcrR family transcriptional regulator [Rhodobacteraceae bacterium]|nr:TetR/AcrR family transcriptional regulator [Paracoccaceae bacterium]
MAKDDRRQEFVDVATELFAEKGFDGTSIAAIADRLGLTKQALLHYFGSKEKLYGIVLEAISERAMLKLVEDQLDTMTPEERLITFFVGYCESGLHDSTDVRLIVRELSDNGRRAEAAGRWYLKPFLQELAAMVQDTSRWRHATQEEALAVAYQVLGAISYFAISGPTLAGMFGQDKLDLMRARYAEQIRETVRRLVE